ncbi:MAG: DUF2510 domain-containing protein [Actinobacteria bacterium]|nr:DUF2510 domain-containing protein [Actinomycetota bacterium]
MSNSQLPAGWYPDPVKPDQRWRRWDGAAWTGDVREVPNGDLRGEDATSTYVQRPGLVPAGGIGLSVAPPVPRSLARTDTAPTPRTPAEPVPYAPAQVLPAPTPGTGSAQPATGSQVYVNGQPVAGQPVPQRPAAQQTTVVKQRSRRLPMDGLTLAAVIASVLALLFAFTVMSGGTVTELVLVLVLIIVAMILNKSARARAKKRADAGPGWLLLVNRLVVLGAIVLLGFGIYALVQGILFSSGVSIPAWL